MLALLSSTANGFMLTSSVRAPVVQSRPTLLMVEVGPNVVSGTCKWFDSSKGFGFIAVDGEESDIFVHQSEIYAPGFRSLADGERVEFKVSADDRTGEQSHFWSPLDCSSHGRARRPRTGVRGTPCTHFSPPATASVGLTQRLLAHRQVEGCRGDGAGGGLRAGCAAPGLQRLRRQLLIIDLQVARALCADSTKWLRSSASALLPIFFWSWAHANTALVVRPGVRRYFMQVRSPASLWSQSCAAGPDPDTRSRKMREADAMSRALSAPRAGRGRRGVRGGARRQPTRHTRLFWPCSTWAPRLSS